MSALDYLNLINEETKECLIIDPADRADVIIRKIKETGACPAGILLTHVDNIVTILHQSVYRTDLRAVVNDNDFALSRLQSQCQNAINAFKQHLNWQVVVSYDKTYQRLGFFM